MNDKAALLNQLRIDRSAAPPPPDRGWLKWLGLAVLAVLVLGGGAWLWRNHDSGVPAKAAPAQDTHATSGGTPAGGSLLDASGYVVARRQATVAAKITDKVMEVLIEEGQHVKQGQVVANLDRTNVQAAYDQAAAQQRQARASLAEVRVQLGNAE